MKNINEIIKENITSHLLKEVSNVFKKDEPYFDLMRQIYSDILPALKSDANFKRRYIMRIPEKNKNDYRVIPIFVKSRKRRLTFDC